MEEMLPEEIVILCRMGVDSVVKSRIENEYVIKNINEGTIDLREVLKIYANLGQKSEEFQKIINAYVMD